MAFPMIEFVRETSTSRLAVVGEQVYDLLLLLSWLN